MHRVRGGPEPAPLPQACADGAERNTRMRSSTPAPRSVGVLGAGRVGAAVARQAVRAGFDVRVATAKPAAEIAMLVEIVVPGAHAVEAAEAADADLVVAAVPLHKYRTLRPDLLAGRTVIDVMNYWAPIDGVIDEFNRDDVTSSEVIQEHLAGARLVKTLNHIGYHDIDDAGRATGSPDRRALAYATDDAPSGELVAGFLDRIGFAPVFAGALAAGRAFQPGTPIFNGAHAAPDLRALLAAADNHAHTAAPVGAGS